MKEGDVVIVPMETADGSLKPRPGIVLRFMPPFDDLLICAISTQLHQEVIGFDETISPSDSDYASSGVRAPSLIRLGYLVMKSRTQTRGRIGSISPSRTARLLEKLARHLSQPSSNTPAIRTARVASSLFSDGDLKGYLKNRAAFLDGVLEQFIPSAETRPTTIHKAMRHSIFAGGKRLRPVLCIAAAEACGGSKEVAALAACAVECLHTYSLIHDDLPCMDDDDLRRGMPTCHMIYGEAMALLAGDALQALAFELVAKSQQTVRYSPADMVLELARTAGSLHLVGGQVADLEGEGKKLPLDDLRYIHESKTAALLTTSIKLGAMCADGMPEELAALETFGRATGLAFQIIDDILDVTQTSEKLGKSAGKDMASEKSTYPALMGLEASREEAHRLTEQARRALDVLAPRDARLRQLADHLLARDF